MTPRGADAIRAALDERRELPALIPYLTAGFPDPQSTPGLLLAAQRCGCRVAEVGIPFSDPLADGPTIQRSGFRALSQGMTVQRAIDSVREARAAGLTIPVVFMTYLNPVLSHGVGRFAAEAAAAGADGLILPDVPVDEADEVRSVVQAAGLALIPLVAPTTTPDRLQRICDTASGFVYCVGVTGVTGARSAVSADALRLLAAVRDCTQLPRALGFGLSRHEHMELLAGHTEAVVVGSALIDAVDRDPADPPRAAKRFLLGMLGRREAQPA